jgi:glycolate oxidase iron-sulfur subunit
MAETLGKLATDLGERSLYDAASQCSRCGYCEQSCPTYKVTGDEKKSPRGRNQLVRLLIEGKLENKEAARESLETCLLCSACSTTCYAHVPTADIVLEGRRLLGDRPWLARFLSRLLLRHPSSFTLLLRCANLAKRVGLSRLARPLLRWAGLPGLATADEHVTLAPLRFSHELLERGAKESKYLQFQPCGTRYLFTGVALATQAVLDTQPLSSGCCGLLAYNYGELGDARAFAQNVIRAAEGDDRSVVADCSSCAAFLKSYPQLFLNDPEWSVRAQRFSARVRDVLEVVEVKGDKTTTYHESCRACHGQGVTADQSGLAPLRDAQDCCGGAGAYAFTQPELSEEVLRRKIARIRETGARTVVTSSTSCLIQLAHGLSKYYPSCTVIHASENAAFSTEKRGHQGGPDGA